jgi:hypothetical protein
MEYQTDFGKTLASFNLLTRALNAKANSKEYYDVKKQMNDNEISVLKHLQHVRSTANYQNKKLNGTIARRGKHTRKADDEQSRNVN